MCPIVGVILHARGDTLGYVQGMSALALLPGRARPTDPADRAARIDALRGQLAALAPPRALPVGLATGLPALEAATGGWARPGLSLIEGPVGSPRLAAVLPALRRLTLAGRQVALVDAEQRIYPPGLDGVLLDNLIIVRPLPGRALWAAEQLARCAALPLVVLLDPPPLGRAARRLEVAAGDGDTALVVISEAPQVDLPARVRLRSRGEGPPPPGPALFLARGGRAGGRWISLAPAGTGSGASG